MQHAVDSQHEGLLDLLDWSKKISWLGAAIMLFGFYGMFSFYPKDLVMAAIAGWVSQVAFWTLQIISRRLKVQVEKEHARFHTTG